MKVYYSNIGMFFLFVFLITTRGLGGETQIPFKVNVIEREEVSYSTPENTYISLHSALMNKDLSWFFEALTTKSVENLKQSFEEANIDLNTSIMREKPKKETYIVEKKHYKNFIVLIIEHIKINGEINRNPQTFIMENGSWKRTDQLSSDEEYHNFLTYFKRSPMETQTNVTYGGVRYDRRARQFYSDATITNVSDKILEGPVWLKITNLQPVDAKLVNADGMHFNEPYIIMLEEEKKWLPGQVLPSKTLYFTNPVRERITFDDIVFAVEPEEDS